jgi:hypothetical protein
VFWEAVVRPDELPKKIEDRRGGLSAGKMALHEVRPWSIRAATASAIGDERQP